MGFFDFLRRKRPDDTGSGSGTLDPTTATAATGATVGEAALAEHEHHDATPDMPDSGGGDAGGGDSGGGDSGGGDSSGG